MTVTHLRAPQSETRDMAERARASHRRLTLGDHEPWNLTNGAFFTTFVVIVAALAVFALVLR
jgi:hypothetical protein